MSGTADSEGKMSWYNADHFVEGNTTYPMTFLELVTVITYPFNCTLVRDTPVCLEGVPQVERGRQELVPFQTCIKQYMDKVQDGKTTV